MGRHHPSYRAMKDAMEDDVEIGQHDGFTVNDRRGMKGLEICRACGLRHDGGAVQYKVQPMDSCIEAYRTRLTRLRDAAKVAYAHVAELREAWRTGAIHDTDGRGGERSNRNVDVEVALRDAIAESEGP